MNDTPTPKPDLREVVLAARNVAKSYGNIHALKGVNFDIHRGQVTTLFGENGAGKSTLMKILSGVIQPTTGQIILDGQPVSFQSSTEARDRGISIIHQELSLAPNLSVRDNIFMGREITGPTGVNFAEEERQVRRLMAELEEDIDPLTPVEELRLGQQQIVEIARAVGGQPHPDHGRTDQRPVRDRGRGAVQGDPRPDLERGEHRLHLAPPRRGAADHGSRRGAARRQYDRLCAARGHRSGMDRAEHGGRKL
ncbi:ATP-binding cassette domain-containing protein [Gemmobacter lanyuensis]